MALAERIRADNTGLEGCDPKLHDSVNFRYSQLLWDNNRKTWLELATRKNNNGKKADSPYSGCPLLEGGRPDCGMVGEKAVHGMVRNRSRQGVECLSVGSAPFCRIV